MVRYHISNQVPYSKKSGPSPPCFIISCFVHFRLLQHNKNIYGFPNDLRQSYTYNLSDEDSSLKLSPDISLWPSAEYLQTTLISMLQNIEKIAAFKFRATTLQIWLHPYSFFIFSALDMYRMRSNWFIHLPSMIQQAVNCSLGIF